MLPVFAVSLSGCPAIIAATGTASGIVANDERTTGSFIEDQTIELKAGIRISEKLGDQVDISVISYNRNVLLVGQAPTEALKLQTEEIVSGIENVRKIYNQIEMGNPASLTAATADTALTTKVKSTLCRLQIEDFSCLDVKVVTEQSIVYILGLVTKKQALIAIETVRNVKGVKKVVKVFEYKEE